MKDVVVVLFLQYEAILEANFCGNRQKIGRKTLICDFGLFTFHLSKNRELFGEACGKNMAGRWRGCKFLKKLLIKKVRIEF